MVSKLLLLNVCGDRPMTAAVVGDAMFVQGSEREFQEWAAADNKYVNRVLQGWIQHKLAIRHHNHILKKREKQERTAKRQAAWQKYMDEKKEQTSKRQELFRAQWQEAWDKQMKQEQLEDYKWKKAFQDVWGRGSYRFWSKKVKKEQEEDGGWEEEFGLVTVGDDAHNVRDDV